MSDSRYRYGVYGVAVVSDTPLALPQYADAGLARVELRRAAAGAFDAAIADASFDVPADSWYRFAALPDGSIYVAWDGVGTFLVEPDGRAIAWSPADGSSLESVQVYMLGQALSFALVKQRLEPLHATVVVIGGLAIALLGENGSGKSTLAASLLDAGARLLTDDLLVVHERAGRLLAFPGAPRIKLFPQIASRYLSGVAAHGSMNPDTQKLILPLDDGRTSAAAVALGATYVVAPPREAGRGEDVRIDPLTPRDALIEVVKATFNRRLVNADRLARQFEMAARVSTLVPIKRLTYPRALDRLPQVRDAVLLDAAQTARGMACASC